MSTYTIRAVTDVPDIFAGQYPGAMRFLTDPLDAELVICWSRLEDPRSDGELVEDFWPISNTGEST